METSILKTDKQKSQGQPLFANSVGQAPLLKSSSLKITDKFITTLKGQACTLGEIRTLADAGDPLAVAFLNRSVLRDPVFRSFSRPQASMDSASRKSAVERKNCYADDVVFAIDGLAFFPGEKEPLTEGEVEALTQTSKGCLWARTYLLRLNVNLVEWKAGRKALERDALNLAWEELLFTPEGHAINPKTGEAFKKEEMLKLKEKRRTEDWVDKYITTRDQQADGWPSEEKTMGGDHVHNDDCHCGRQDHSSPDTLEQGSSQTYQPATTSGGGGGSPTNPNGETPPPSGSASIGSKVLNFFVRNNPGNIFAVYDC